MHNASEEFQHRLDEIDAVMSSRNETVILRNSVKSEISRLRSKLERVRSIASRVSNNVVACTAM